MISESNLQCGNDNDGAAIFSTVYQEARSVFVRQQRKDRSTSSLQNIAYIRYCSMNGLCCLVRRQSLCIYMI